MSKKIAILVRDRQGEAMRMAVGAILMDDAVDVYVLDRKVEDTEENALNLETMGDMDVKTFTNSRENADMEYVATEDIAARLLDYDHIVPY
jgi:hypothetical protein